MRGCARAEGIDIRPRRVHSRAVGKAASKKTTAKKAVATKVAGKASLKRDSAETYRGAKVLGVTTDGVRILKGKGRSSNFTAKEIRAAVAIVRAARDGQ